LSECLQELRTDIHSLGRFADNLFDRKGFSPEPGVVYVSTCHAAKGLEWDTVFISALTRVEFPGTSRDKIRSELWFLPDAVVNPEALALAELSAVQGEAIGELDPVTRAKLETVAERLRLLYVAVTRARENLMLTSHSQDKYKKPAHQALAYQYLKRRIDARQGR
jgi:DNA helicase-2/ATP-dependent DNA helicase PcrA